MSDRPIDRALEILSSRIGRTLPPSEWFEMTQTRVDQFADVTLDHQWIHVDQVRANAGPFGTTIAHGHLTLSLMSHLPKDEASRPPVLPGQKLVINYGFDKIRFPSPVPVGSRIRTERTLRRVEIKDDMLETMYEVVVQIEGGEKPACVAQSLLRIVF